ncbi:xanthine dehydrogenase small subunit [Nocardioides panaciterrulae]|uniref:Xanthine dehydrogenase small subunit n=1 Tax=Nocardioides panaciterrulae TaxID=661492 RepID=A0A7Y9JAK1_9ACTN|nr:FAD binding domain-containing protein [Nocardioides panaciterrulae]NYD40404.1 xanthine dehydrogenase small subunit [Nocardioides panaciterrulae]
MDTPTATVNGTDRPLAGTPAYTSALTWLRALGLTGAKEGCNEGECGACSVLLARPAPTGDLAGDGADLAGGGAGTEWTAVNACLLPAAALAGQEVVTAEGLGTSRDLHPVQRELAHRGGSQCGYCTPGFVCSMAAEYYRPGRTANGTADPEHGPNGFDLHALSGNLCRCTGYRPIRDAAFALAAQAPADDPLAVRRAGPAPRPSPGRNDAEGAAFVRPATLADALAVLAEHPAAVVVAGSTDWGVEVNLRAARAPLTVAVDRLPELRGFAVDADRIELGAALTLTEVERALDGRVPLLAAAFPLFASRLIRNAATLGGNLATASPIGDTPPALLALDATVLLAAADGEREVPLAEFFTGYRQTVRRPDELIRAVRIPLPLAPLTGFHKIAKRRFDDISSVAVGFALDVADGVVRRARIGLGGVAATPVRALRTEEALTGRPWTEGTVRAAAEVMAAEGTPMDDHRASAAYRSAMLGQALLKLWARTDEAQLDLGGRA